MLKKDTTDVIRWGILGTGNIAQQFAKGLSFLPDAQLLAIGSRREETARDFANNFHVPHTYASYEELATSTDVDVVYIATPHIYHKQNTLLCLKAGKAVVCEKPLAINAKEATEMIAVAREQKLFLMEAMWTRFIPLMVKVRKLLTKKVIGEVRLLTADFGFLAPYNLSGRLFNLALGGGALLDIGVYPLSLAFMIFGPPSCTRGMAHLGKTKVDEQSAVILAYEEGQLAILYFSLQINTPQEAIIMGSHGHIRIHAPFWQPCEMTVSVRGKNDVIQIPFSGNGYNYEAHEVMNCLLAGKTESDIMPLDESLEILKTMDDIRQCWGLTYLQDAECE